jgi:anti-anti-sigma factor
MAVRHQQRFRLCDALNVGEKFEQGVPTVLVADDGTVVLEVSQHTEPDRTVVMVAGEVDVDTVAVLSSALLRALAGARPVSADLAGVTFFGAAGTRSLSGAYAFAASTDRRLRLRNVPYPVEMVLDVLDPSRVLLR